MNDTALIRIHRLKGNASALTEHLISGTLCERLDRKSTRLNSKIAELDSAIVKAQGISDVYEAAKCYHDEVFATMQSLRACLLYTSGHTKLCTKQSHQSVLKGIGVEQALFEKNILFLQTVMPPS